MNVATGSVFLLLVSLAFCQAPSYNFPTRYRGLVYGATQDAFTGNHKAVSVGWIYTDNTVPTMRIDEVWELETLYETSLGAEGITSDTHLYFASNYYYFFTNGTGGYCSSAAFGLFPQQWPASSFVGQTVFDGIVANQFNQSYSILPSSLWVSVETNQPLAIFIGPQGTFHPLYDGSFVVFQKIQEVDDFEFGSQLFAKPSYCK